MRCLFWVFLLILAAHGAAAQSIMDNLPPAIVEGAPAADAAAAKPAAVTTAPETYVVTDIHADAASDTASHARDNALIQAERGALSQLQARLGLPDTAAKMSDDDVALLVQSFEVQSEKASATRYIGVYTIRFKPAAIQKKFAKASAALPTVNATDTSPDTPKTDAAKSLSTGPVSHITVAVRADSLATWGKIKNRIQETRSVAMIEVLELARGVSHIDISYVGPLSDLQNALTYQGLVLRQNTAGIWEIYDGSMVDR